jgi:hypothetical protein
MLAVFGGIWLQQTSDSRETSYSQVIGNDVISEFVLGGSVIYGVVVGLSNRFEDDLDFGYVIVIVCCMMVVLVTVSSSSGESDPTGQDVYFSSSGARVSPPPSVIVRSLLRGPVEV